MNSDHRTSLPHNTLSGGIYATAAFLLWGLLPLYWKWLKDVPAFEVLCHRICWSFVFLMTWLAFVQNRRLKMTVQGIRITWTLVASTVMISTNWFIYIWAVGAGHVLETSMGYFVNPLLNVVLGMVFLGERLRPIQWCAVGVAALGVLNLTVNYGHFPWIALALATTFGCYGLLRKISHVSAFQGLWIETALLSVPVLFVVGAKEISGSGALFHGGVETSLLLVGAGIVTAIPLLWFGNAAKRLRLSTLGFFQYLAPSAQFLLAVFVFHERFTAIHFVTFGFIWIALTIYSLDSLNQAKKVTRQNKDRSLKCAPLSASHSE